MYEDGANANYTVYQDKYKNMTKDYEKFNNRKVQDAERPKAVEATEKALKKVEEKVAEMKESKPWITEEEKKDVLDKMKEIK